MPNELVDYISDGLKKGYTESYLRQTLLQQGWNPNDVNQAFAAARGSVPQPSPSASQPIQPQSIVSRDPSKTTMKLRRIGVLSSAKISALVCAIIGVFLGIMFILPALIFGSSLSAIPSTDILTATGADPLGFFALLATLGMFMAVAFPIVLAIMGFITGAIFALIYNLVAGWVGGYEVEFEE